MTDMISLAGAAFVNSPDVSAWPATIGITEVSCDPRLGFRIRFDRPVPAAWKWPSNPDVPSDNFQYTVFFGHVLGGRLVLAGLVQMWQGRMEEADAAGQHPIPPLRSVPPGDTDPGYVNLWGDPRNLWPPLSGYVPQVGDQIAILVAAGNGRMTADVTSVAERSNVILWTLPPGDVSDILYGTGHAPPPPPVDPPPIVPPPVVPVPPATDPIAALTARFDRLEQLLAQNDAIAAVRYAALIKAVQQLQPAAYEGTFKIPYLGAGAITLTPKGGA